MRAYIGFDDTDTIDADFGTGKLVRRFGEALPAGCRLWGVVRQQLLVDDRIPYTSHNSSACAVVDFDDPSLRQELVSQAVDHIEKTAAPGSDPGLCLVCEDDAALTQLMIFGKACAERVMTQKDALEASAGVHISGHGGTNDGIIGAAAGVGLTASGWSGRFIEYNQLRSHPDRVAVAVLQSHGIRVVSFDRNAIIPSPDDMVHTKGWLRPRLLGNSVILPVLPRGENHWESMGKKNKPT
jgi:tRNA(Ile2) C34 agmatinyltransferase TiaS